jgi:hypothetical protein
MLYHHGIGVFSTQETTQGIIEAQGKTPGSLPPG